MTKIGREIREDGSLFFALPFGRRNTRIFFIAKTYEEYIRVRDFNDKEIRRTRYLIERDRRMFREVLLKVTIKTPTDRKYYKLFMESLNKSYEHME